MKKNTLLIGRGTVAVNCLNVLEEMDRLPKIIVCDTRDNGEDTWTKSLYKKALEFGYVPEKNLFKETRVNRPEFIKKIKNTEINIDIILSIQPYAIFKMPFIHLAKDYVVNLHMAPLPKLRGVSPIPWAFLDGLKEMGVTLHLIEDEGVDNGPIIFQKLFPVEDDDTAWTLYHKCINIGTQLFKENAKDILNGNIHPKKQNEKEVTYHPMGEIDLSESEVDLSKDCNTVFNFIRSRIFPVFQLPYFYHNGKKIKISGVKKLKKRNITKIENKDGKFYIPFKDEMLVITAQEI
ncbi:MAG: hypothetical protein COU27_02015 [Candidatus Levybacteria bacterium CG10_big_fil_rev_8_21_14_0_10_36_7]|nr:MAG: hypothetical protein COU27_02015 [Candidatus Levybacteria bacterium CG10_big_fil_rev_8_21_14_0_10_36_7]